MGRAQRRMLPTILLLGALVLTGCGAKPQADPNDPLAGTITASGSTALLPLASIAAEIFEEQHPNATVNVSGGGSYNGLAQVAAGAVEIGNSDVAATGDLARELVEHKVAIAPFVIIAHPENPVTGLTTEQLARMLRGEITNWREVGGPDLEVMVVSRQQSSGSRATIVEKVLGGEGDISPQALVQDSNGKVVATVQYTPGAVGYVDAAYFRPNKVKALELDGVAYSPEAVLRGEWPIFAYEYMYTRGEPNELTRAFLDFVLSPEFQEEYVAEHGFVPILRDPHR
ncbi:phosphate transport system substrate-binding protein [Symbiobacterium terraclitae]|uniref:Phosphate-binding protein n=1 Tax=Symbiobacterium terraclitae TaxID=557451 RepID=A0ABS4JYR6_9FIRM|nr:phosphate ABC transporter substrate-binding protein [Symbiobacterium terraclitae]MBP2020130.1 phosphate transport system substrate-binding protein [Symbiobacterium terraclitae]